MNAQMEITIVICG